MNKILQTAVIISVIAGWNADATSVAAEDSVVVAKDVKDIIAFGGRMVLNNSKAKLLGGAAGEITTTDSSFDDVVIAGGSISMQGGSAKSVKAAGGKIDLGLNVAGNLSLAAGQVILNDIMKVGGDTEIHGGMVDVQGTYQGDVEIDGDKVTVGGKIGGDLIIAAKTASIAPGTIIGGNFKAPEGTEIPDDVAIGGTRKVGGSARVKAVAPVPPVSPEAPVPRIKRDGVTVEIDLDDADTTIDKALDGASASKSVSERLKKAAGKASKIHTPDQDESSGLISPSPMGMQSWLTILVTLAACGALALGIAPQFVARAAERLAKEPLPSLGIGAASLVAVPLALLAVGITIIGIPFAVLGAAAYAIGIGLGLIALCLWGGLMVRTLANQPGQETRVSKLVGWTLMGFLALALIGAVPFVGRVIQILAITTGAGAVLSTAWALRSKSTPVSVT